MAGIIRYQPHASISDRETIPFVSASVTIPVSKSILIRQMAIYTMQILTKNASPQISNPAKNSLTQFIQAFPEESSLEWPRDCKVMWQAITQWLTALKSPNQTQSIIIYFQDAGTPARLFTAMAATANLPITITGNASLQSRSMQPLVTALRDAGAKISYLEKEGFLPISIQQPIQKLPAQLLIDQSFSSQYLSALSIIAAFHPTPCNIIPTGEPHSLQYWHLTQKMLEMATPVTLNSIPGDWSAASFFYGLCASIPYSQIFISPLSSQQLQSDESAADFFRHFNVETILQSPNTKLLNHTTATHPNSSLAVISFNMENNPDMVPVLVITALLQEKSIILQNINNLQFKESNRLEALMQVSQILGASLQPWQKTQADEYLLQIPQNGIQWPNSITLDTRNDHRLAMAYSLLATKIASVELSDIHCVEKSFPNYWEQLRLCNFEITV